MIRLKDYTRLSDLEDYNKLKEFTDISDDNLEEKGFIDKEDFLNRLCKINNQKIIIVPENVMYEGNIEIISQYNGEYWTQNYVGFLEYNEENIIISSRFEKNNSFNFTHYILSEALELHASIFPDMKIKVTKERILDELLAIVFINQIKYAYRKGIYRKYRTYTRNDSKIKGKIDIANHIRLNLIFNGNIAYSYREYTVDNDVNKLILTAYTFLEKRCGAFYKNLLRDKRDVVNYIAQLKNSIHPASPQEIKDLVKKVNKKIVHPIYKEWEAVRKTAIMILRHMGVHMTETGDKEISGILIDMNKIWELYLEKIMRDLPNNIILKSQEQSHFLMLKEKVIKSIKPDFCFYKDSQKHPVLILDAKYKNAWQKVADGSNADWPREDCFQLVTYMHILKCLRVGIVCPVDKEVENDEVAFIWNNEGEQICVIPLEISQEEDMYMYIEDMREKEKKFISKVKRYLN